MSGLPRRQPGRQATSLACWTANTAGNDAELRCGCGSLMARLLAGDIELKCRRCKQVVVLQLSEDVAETGCALDHLACTCEPD
jgi:phage FluMu protein Com